MSASVSASDRTRLFQLPTKITCNSISDIKECLSSAQQRECLQPECLTSENAYYRQCYRPLVSLQSIHLSGQVWTFCPDKFGHFVLALKNSYREHCTNTEICAVCGNIMLGYVPYCDKGLYMQHIILYNAFYDFIKGCKVIGEQGLTVQTEPALHKPDNTKDVNLGVFDINDRVEDIFITFVSELSDILKASKCEFTLLRSSCIKSDMPLARVNKLPSDFVDKVDATSNLNELLELLNKSSHCNWMNIRVFERMAAASKQSKAKTLVTNYKKIIFSKKINDILEELPDLEITDDYYTKVKDKWSKDLKDITISDVVDRWCKLQKIFDVEDLEILLQNIIKGSIIFHWLIPACLVTQVRYSVFRNWYNLEDFAYLCIGSHMIKDDQFDFNEDCLSATTGMKNVWYAVLVICIYSNSSTSDRSLY